MKSDRFLIDGSHITIGVIFGVTNKAVTVTVECGAADRAASERMSATSICKSECVQCTCAKGSALPTDQCSSIFLLPCRYDSDEDRHAAYLSRLQARKACQSHVQQQRKLLQRYRSVYHVYQEA